MKNTINSLYKVKFDISDIFLLMPLDKFSIILLSSILPLSLMITFFESDSSFSSFNFVMNTFFIYLNVIAWLICFYSIETNNRFKFKYDLMKYIDVEDKQERQLLFNKSSNIYYKNGQSYKPELINKFISSENPAIIKNDFFPNNIVTLITNRKQLKNINIDSFNRKYLFKLLRYCSFSSCYVTPTINLDSKDNNMHFLVVNIVNESKNYFCFYNHLKDHYSNETIKEILFSFIFYHEMNHASFLQHKLNLNIDEYEAISDIASLLMLKKVYNMDRDKFSALLKAACSYRECNNIYSKTESYYFNLDCFVLLGHINNWNEDFLTNISKEDITDFAIILKVYVFQNLYDFELLHLISPFYSENDVINFLNTYTESKDYKKIQSWNNELSSKYNLIEYLSYKKIIVNKDIYQQNFKNSGEHFFIENYESRHSIIKDIFNHLPTKISLKDIIQYSSIYNKEFYNSIVYDEVCIFNREALCSFFQRYGYNI